MSTFAMPSPSPSSSLPSPASLTYAQLHPPTPSSSSSSLSSSSSSSSSPPPSAPTVINGQKICCACPETRKPRDECIVANGAENCFSFIEDHKKCLRKMGFQI